MAAAQNAVRGLYLLPSRGGGVIESCRLIRESFALLPAYVGDADGNGGAGLVHSTAMWSDSKLRAHLVTWFKESGRWTRLRLLQAILHPMRTPIRMIPLQDLLRVARWLTFLLPQSQVQHANENEWKLMPIEAVVVQ